MSSTCRSRNQASPPLVGARAQAKHRRAASVAAAFVASILALVACGPYPSNTFEATSDYARDISIVFLFIIYLAALVFVVVMGIFIYAAVRFRGKPGDPRPVPVHGNTRIEIIWTIIPVIILAIILVPTVQLIFSSQADTPPDALQVTAIGHQWWFELHYPEQNIRTANELHIPLNRTVNIGIESADVMHSFWPPKLAGKRDMIPNHRNYIYFKPDKTGTYFGECTEFCGPAHAHMLFEVVVDTPADFDQWVKAQQQPAVAPTDPQAQQGAKVFASAGCVACHAVGGTNAASTIGPNLTHLKSRNLIAAATLANDPESLKKWIRDPSAIKPGEGTFPNTMPAFPASQVSDSDLDALVAYLQTLK